MLDKLQAVADRFEELCARSEQPDFYNDPKKAAAILRERNDLEPIVDAMIWSPSSKPIKATGTPSGICSMPRSLCPTRR